MPHKVRVNTGYKNVQLPNGGHYDGQVDVVLTDEEFSQLPGTAFTGGTLADLGMVGASGDAVTTQAPVVAAVGALTSAAPVALTSSQNATANGSDPTTTQALANALKVSYNALQVDVAALRTAQGLIQADVATLRTAVNAVLTSLKTAGGPMAAA